MCCEFIVQNKEIIVACYMCCEFIVQNREIIVTCYMCCECAVNLLCKIKELFDASIASNER